jgi:uncharacterized membrane protein
VFEKIIKAGIVLLIIGAVCGMIYMSRKCPNGYSVMNLFVR